MYTKFPKVSVLLISDIFSKHFSLPRKLHEEHKFRNHNLVRDALVSLLHVTIWHHLNSDDFDYLLDAMRQYKIAILCFKLIILLFSFIQD
jgi:hypothetical protein